MKRNNLLGTSEAILSFELKCYATAADAASVTTPPVLYIKHGKMKNRT